MVLSKPCQQPYALCVCLFVCVLHIQRGEAEQTDVKTMRRKQKEGRQQKKTTKAFSFDKNDKINKNKNRKRKLEN